MLKRDDSGQDGMALILVLWFVAALAILVSAFNASVRSGAAVASSGMVSAERHFARLAALEIAAAELIMGDNKDPWRQGAGEKQLTINNQKFRIGLEDPNGLIDLNQADGELIFGLVRQFTSRNLEAEQIRDRIIDWRDRDDKRRPNGAEDFEYKRGRASFGAGDTHFIHKSQLRNVLELKPEIFHKIAPFVTTYGRDGSINKLTAPEIVLKATQSGLTKTAKAPPKQNATSKQTAATQEATQSPEDAQKSKFGPSHTIVVRPAGKRGQTIRTTILIVRGDKAPFRILAQETN